MDEARILLDLLDVPSPSGDERAACGVFAEHARLLGFRVRTDAAGNVLASTGSGKPHTMFLGHIDTVPGFWPVRLDGEELHGRGAVDAKGAVVAGLVAVARIGEATPGTRTVVAAVREESDSAGVRELLKHPPPDALIVGEPSGWDRVTIGFRGRRTGTFRAVGTPSHASSPSPGTLDRAVEVASGIRAAVLAKAGEGLFNSPTCRITRWTYTERLSEEITEFEADVRAAPGFEWAALEGCAPEARWSAPLEGVVVDKGNPAVRALVGGIRAAGGRPHYLLKGGTSDMNHASATWRIPMCSYGPGDPTLDHGPTEHLSLLELSRSIDVLRRAVLQLSL